MINTRDRITLVSTIILATLAFVGAFLFVSGCSHLAPPVTPNHAIEYVTLLDKAARCEDWRDQAELGATHSALCLSGPDLFWCVAPRDAKPHCDLLFSPPKPEAKKDEPKVEAPKPKEP